MEKIIIIGCGKMGYSLANYLIEEGIEIVGFTDIQRPQHHISGYHKKYLGNDDEILNYSPEEVSLVMALSEMYMKKREELFFEYKELGYYFRSVIFKNAIIAKDVLIGEGTIIFNSANINSFVNIGHLVTINSNSSIDHDCYIGNNVYISPGVTIAGSIKICDNTMIGSGATILPTRVIGKGSVVGAGAVVVKNVPEDVIVTGVPAQFFCKNK